MWIEAGKTGGFGGKDIGLDSLVFRECIYGHWLFEPQGIAKPEIKPKFAPRRFPTIPSFNPHALGTATHVRVIVTLVAPRVSPWANRTTPVGSKTKKL